MLRGKSENEWCKYWVVLAGLSIKLYKVTLTIYCDTYYMKFKDVWAEDGGKPQIEIDLTECENVYPSSSARNYGIEIKVRFAFKV